MMKMNPHYLLFGSAAMVIFGYVLTSSYEVGICMSDVGRNIFDVSCHQLYDKIGDPIFYGGLALSIVFVLLIAFPKAYGAWKKFAIWFVPLAALLFVFYPTPGSGDFLTPMPEQLFQWVSALYVVISGIIIAIVKK